MITIKYMPAISGGHGMIVWVNSKHKKIYEFFKLIWLWINNCKKESDGSTTMEIELPVGIDENNELLKLALFRLSARLETKNEEENNEQIH